MMDRHEFRILVMEVSYLITMVATIVCIVLIFLL